MPPSSLSPAEVAALIESQILECKKSLSQTDAGLESLDAMVNTDGGKGLVLFGVSPDGLPCGIDPETQLNVHLLTVHVLGLIPR